MIHTDTVRLIITYDDQDDGFNVPRLPPREWDWESLLDLGPDESVEEECPAGGPHTPTNASSHPDRMFDPYWHCDDCGASLPTPERSY